MNKESQMKTVNFVNTNPSDKPLAISSKYYGCPYQEYALSFGLCWGGEIMRPHYVEVLKKIFPNTFIYNGWDKSFHDWEGNSFTVLDLLARYKAIRFYSGDIDVENNIFQSFKNNANNKTDIKINKIFSNEDTQENIYELFCSPKNNGGTLLK
jgi:hypothetical protein